MRDRTDDTPRAPADTDARERRDPGRASEIARDQSKRVSPRFRDLDDFECRTLLARNHVGRLAYSFRDRVSIEPVNYVLEDDWLYGRTAPSEKIEVIRRSRWVGFQVDEIVGVFDWQSAVVHGAFYVLHPDGAPDELTARDRAIQLMRLLIPETGTAEDPVPHRNIFFRIHMDRLEGRRATTAPGGDREVPLE
mgnify:CR=1 FL=1